MGAATIKMVVAMYHCYAIADFLAKPFDRIEIFQGDLSLCSVPNYALNVI